MAKIKISPQGHADGEVKSKKAKYNPPVFRVYGSVSKLTRGGAGGSVDGPMTTMMVASDRRIKENILQMGIHPAGFGLYLFDYKPDYRDQWGHGRQFGVMADEVETVKPGAVTLHPDGYKMVNYGMLGITRLS